MWASSMSNDAQFLLTGQILDVLADAGKQGDKGGRRF